MNNTKQPQIAKGLIKTLTILHFAYCAAILAFGITSVFITKNAKINFADTDDIFFYFIPVFALAATFASYFLFQKNLKEVQKKTSLKEKLSHHQSAKIIQYAMIEAPAILGVVIFINTTNQFYLIISALILAYLIFLRPTTSVIKENLGLNAEQKREFEEEMR